MLITGQIEILFIAGRVLVAGITFFTFETGIEPEAEDNRVSLVSTASASLIRSPGG